MVAKATDSIFINCPFDDAYKPMFDAIVFAIYKCDFLPRCAKEVDDASESRLGKIEKIIRECRLGIHDISRTDSNEAGLPRFNMPLELGLFLGAKQYGTKEQKQKKCLIFDVDRHRYQQFISDIAGQDVTSHDGDVRTAVIKVRDWLNTIRTAIPSGSLIWQEYEEFQVFLPKICDGLSLVDSEFTFQDYLRVVYEWINYQESIAKEQETIGAN